MANAHSGDVSLLLFLQILRVHIAWITLMASDTMSGKIASITTRIQATNSLVQAELDLIWLLLDDWGL